MAVVVAVIGTQKLYEHNGSIAVSGVGDSIGITVGALRIMPSSAPNAIEPICPKFSSLLECIDAQNSLLNFGIYKFRIRIAVFL